jgi:hypothetical protein
MCLSILFSFIVSDKHFSSLCSSHSKISQSSV